MSHLSSKRLRPGFVAILLGLLVLIVSACGTQTTTASPTTADLSLNQNHVDKSDDNSKITYNTTDLSWNSQSHQLTVKVNVNGLVPNSVHPNHIHQGNCNSNGAVIYPLNNIVADKDGNSSTKTVISNVMNGIPASGWYVNVHHGPTLNSADQMAPIYCGNVSNEDHNHNVTLKLNQIFINQFANLDKVASTVPGNGDVNPYGVAIVQKSVGNLVKDNVLVSNFNNGQNLQGTGTTIVQITPDGQQSVFAQLTSASCPDGIGLTTALVELKRGWVIVGSLPAADGKFANVKPGCLIVLDSQGKIVKTFTGAPINEPWDATAIENGDGSQAELFVTNILNGIVPASTNVVNQGTVVRIGLRIPEQGEGTPSIHDKTVIGLGFSEKTDAAALVIGPTGVGLGKNDILYVADTLNNRIIAIPDALVRQSPIHADRHVLIANGSLNAELGLTIAPNGDILTVNGGDGNILEITPAGVQVAKKLISSAGNPPGAGCLFGLNTIPDAAGVYFVDDCTNQLNALH